MNDKNEKLANEGFEILTAIRDGGYVSDYDMERMGDTSVITEDMTDEELEELSEALAASWRN